MGKHNCVFYNHDIGFGTRFCGGEVNCCQNTQNRRAYTEDPVQIDLGLLVHMALFSARACKDSLAGQNFQYDWISCQAE